MSRDLNGTVETLTNGVMSVEQAREWFDVHPILERFGAWVVTTYGVECLATHYAIELSRVFEMDWMSHMRLKTWPDLLDFENALDSARQLAERRKQFTIRRKPFSVFLCHGREDKAPVRDLYYRLVAEGVQPWLDEENLLPGQDWKYEAEQAVRQSDVVLVCLSRTSVEKTGFVQKEIRYALDAADEKPDGTIYIIPARLEDCQLPDRLASKHCVDLFGKEGFARLRKALIAACHRKASAAMDRP